jgi:hypothetical protein
MLLRNFTFSKHSTLSRQLGLSFSFSASDVQPTSAHTPHSRAMAHYFLFLSSKVFFGYLSTPKLTSRGRQTLLRSWQRYIRAHVTTQTKLLNSKIITHHSHTQKKNYHALSTVVMDFLVLGALTLLRLLLWSL